MPHILGFGEFTAWECANSFQLFSKYSDATGFNSEASLTSALQELKPELSATDLVGNVVLENFTVFCKPVLLTDVGLQNLSFPMKYLPYPDPIASFIATSMVSA